MGILNAIIRPFNDDEYVYKKDEKKKEISIEHKVGRAADYGFEKVSNFVQHGLVLAGREGLLLDFLSKAGNIIDVTRMFGYGSSLLTSLTEKRHWKTDDYLEFAANSALFFTSVIGAGVALGEFGIANLGWIGDGIGTFASYGGLGFVFVGGAIPFIHAGIGIGVAFYLIMGVKDLYNDWDDAEMDNRHKAFGVLKALGQGAEITLRVVAIWTGTAPILIPVLGMISNGTGFLAIVNTTYDQDKVRGDYSVKNKNRLTGKIKEIFEINAEKILKEKPKEAADKRYCNPLWLPFLLFKPVLDGTAEVFSSIKGMQRLGKVTNAVIDFALPQFKILGDSIKSFRLVTCGFDFIGTINNNLHSKESRKKFLDEVWNKSIKNLSIGRISEGFVFMGQLADLGKFVAKVAGYSGELGKFTIFGIPGRVSFSSLKPTFMAVHLILKIIEESRNTWKAYNEIIPNDRSIDKYNEGYGSYYSLFKLGMSGAKLGVIVLSGGFILFAGYSTVTWYMVVQIGVFGLDFAEWVYKNHIIKPHTQVFKMA